MLRKLNKEELQAFIEKYIPEWRNDILEVSCLDFGEFKSYLVNGHYLVAVFKDKIETLDFQQFQ